MQDRITRLAPLAFRVLFSLIFVAAGMKHLRSPDSIVARLTASSHADLVTALASPHTLVVLAGVALLVGGVALLIGLRTRLSAALLIAVLLPITLTVQVGNPEGSGPLFKNIALLGGLLHFAANGGGAWAVDAWLGERRRASFAALSAVGLAALLAAVPAFASGPGTAATKKGERVLFLVQQPPQLKAALDTGIELLSGKGFPAAEVEVLVCGPAVSSLLSGDPMEAKLADGARAGVHTVACGLTLAEKNIDRAKLAPVVGVVENGLIEALQKQAAGYRSVEL